MQHDLFEPSFVVDVSVGWEAKLAALACYRTQLHQPDDRDARPSGPPTKVGSPEFRAAVEARARHFGLLVGAAFGEPFWSRTPLAVGDPMAILPQGLR
jgi:LmbE family N-acetylglucosaminyl deacetylase